MRFDDDTLARFKEQLLQRQQELASLEQTINDSAKAVELDQTRVGRLSRMDALQAQALSLAANRRRQIELQQISAAFRRIEAGEYGYCVECDEAIAIERLEFDPATALCINCADRLEKAVDDKRTY